MPQNPLGYNADGSQTELDGVAVANQIADVTALSAYKGAVTRLCLPDGRSYRYDVNSTETVDGGLVLAATGKGGGRWMGVWSWSIDALFWYGDKVSGGDYAPAFQAAISYATAKGVGVYIREGSYQINTGLVATLYNNTGLSSTGGRRFRLWGAGQNQTSLIYAGVANTVALKYVGTFDEYPRISDFRIVPKVQGDRNTTGLRIENIVNFDISNVSVGFFNTGIELVNSNEGNLSNVTSEWNNVGLTAVKNPTPGKDPNGNNLPIILPNVISFNTCHFNSNVNQGVIVTDGCANKFDTCTFLGNGSDTNGRALKVVYSGFNGGNGLDCENCFFESTKGYDIELQTSAAGSFQFLHNTFNKLNNTRYATAHIVFTPTNLVANDGKKTIITALGNSFWSQVGTPDNNDYVPDASRPVIRLEPGANGYNGYQILEHNHHKNEVERPKYNGSTTKPRFADYGAKFITNPDQLLDTGVYNIPPTANRTGGTMPTAVGVDNWHLYHIQQVDVNGNLGVWAYQTTMEFRTGITYTRSCTDGTWQAWRRVTPTVAYTPTGTSDAFGSQGDLTYDDNALYLKTSKGFKRVNLLPATVTGKNHFLEVATSSFDSNNQTNVRITSGYFKKLAFPNVVSDAESLWDSSNFWYTAPEAGQYVITTIFRPQDAVTAGKRYGQGAGLTAADSPTYLWSQTNNVSNGSYNQRIMTLTAGQQVFMNVSLDGFDSYVQAGMTIYKLP